MPRYRFKTRITGDHEPDPTIVELNFDDDEGARREGRCALAGLIPDMMRKDGSGVEVGVERDGKTIYEADIEFGERTKKPR